MRSLTLAIVGRPNVGKSTLFNCLTRTRQALVVDRPGVTRDRLYGKAEFEGIPYHLVDTCGVDGEQVADLYDAMSVQLESAIGEASHVLLMVDAKTGLLPEDKKIALKLRTMNKSVYVVVNKIDGMDPDIAMADFHRLGFKKIFAISAAHNRGMLDMMEQITEDLGLLAEAEEVIVEEEPKGIKMAVLGRPNVGKSTLINRMLQEERVVVFDAPGTTRDSIYIPFERHNKHYTLIDTAGIRRKSKVFDVVEKFSVIKSLQAIKDADCVILVLNAHEDIFDQDLNLLREVQLSGRALVIAINKWDGLSAEAREEFKKKLTYKTLFLPKVRVHTISALHGTGVGDLFDLVEEAVGSATGGWSSSKLTTILERAVAAHTPPMGNGGRIKLKYAHAVGSNPIRILIHGNQTDSLPESYKKYLQNAFSQGLKLVGAALKLEFRSGDNPFKGKRQQLTNRQIQKKKRLMKFAKRRSS